MNNRAGVGVCAGTGAWGDGDGAAFGRESIDMAAAADSNFVVDYCVGRFCELQYVCDRNVFAGAVGPGS